MLKVNDEIIGDPEELCELIINTFVWAFTKCNQDERITSNFNSYTLADLEFTLSTVRDSVGSLRPFLGSDYDRVPASLIKYGGFDIPILLAKIFNLSCDSDIFPKQ